MPFPHYRQLDAMDCGPTCLRMVAKHYGRSVSLEYLRSKTEYGKQGASLLGLANAAEALGFHAVGAKLTLQQLLQEAPLPAILHWDQHHFVVLTPATKKGQVQIADPAKGLLLLSHAQLQQHWLSTQEGTEAKGIALLLEATPALHTHQEDDAAEEQAAPKVFGWWHMVQQLGRYRRYLLQVGLGLLLGSLLQLIFPFLTQSLVDTGINTRNLHFIQIILAAQLMLLLSQTLVEFIRSRILLHVSTRVNLQLLSAFWAKLLRLPIHFFDTKHPGDILQRLSDQQRIEQFLTGTALSTLFSLFNLLVFSVVLLQYNAQIFMIFAAGSVLYFLWIRLFLRFRRRLDYQRFAIMARESNASMQLVYGVQEIKLNNAEHSFRWKWEGLQAAVFRLNFKSLSLNQYQQFGALFINQGKNILITFLVAQQVVEGKLSLGVMLAVQYIIGQLNAPIEQLIGFTQQAQDASISLERMNDIQVLPDEEPAARQFQHRLPQEHSIHINNLSFTYPGAGNEPVLRQLSLTIPAQQTTAIVGLSGSGKTTLLKLLLRFYETYSGSITIGATAFSSISPRYWRSRCGVVMQDSYVFNDTILKKITVTEEPVDMERVLEACRIANILDYIEALPLGFYTKLGAEGVGMSGGQRQRLALARAVYKQPQFIFLDEATNSLDANNEKVIVENLQRFCAHKTVLVVAHRLSTVRHAHKIVVMHKGAIAEEGTHESLVNLRGRYYELVKNQLELGNE
ncbi:MAG: peptidase domain-containing ABC transporter [Chitinophagaceae bacterium]|nr:peptidase domain-containing ABC transporter [Chitinophagaceae bacterium]